MNQCMVGGPFSLFFNIAFSLDQKNNKRGLVVIHAKLSLWIRHLQGY